MMEAAVDSFINFAKAKLLPFFEAEAMLLRYGLPKEMEEVADELERIHRYLSKAEMFADEDDDTKKEVKEVRGIMYRLQDVVDCYDLIQLQRSQLDEHGIADCVGISRFFPRAVLLVKQLKPLHGIAYAIVEAKTGIHKHILQGRDGKSASYLDRPHFMQPKEESYNFRCANESYFVGFDGPKNELIKLLDLDKRMQEMRLFVAVTGTGGIGKTTLMEKVYREVKGRFKMQAWVTVSQSYKPADILKSIFKQFNASTNTLDSKPCVVDVYREYMEKNLFKSYIVVLDDVWDTGLLNWIDGALPSSQERSRILMTTRNEGIAKYWTSNIVGPDPYRLNPLSEDDAWLLFCKKAFNDDHCPKPVLEQVSLEILEWCRRLPLAIVTVAGLVSTKEEDASVWSEVRDDLIGTEFKTGWPNEYTKRIMLYSYHELPYKLKPCFLYFGMYPENVEIKVEELVRIWVVEGFIKTQRGHTLEEVAETYLNELIQRGLVMVTDRYEAEFYTFGAKAVSEHYVKVHDIVHELIRCKLEELEFCQVLPNNSSSSSNVDGKPRRLSLYNVVDDTHPNDDEMLSKVIASSSCSIRSILSHDSEGLPSSLVRSLPKFATSLRVLQIESMDDGILEEVGKLQNLRFLNVRNMLIANRIPISIFQLLNLETLDLRFSYDVKELPREMKRLCKLRHLLIDEEVKIAEGVLTCKHYKKSMEIEMVYHKSCKI